MKKRFIAVILCLAAIFTLSVGAFADNGTDVLDAPIIGETETDMIGVAYSAEELEAIKELMAEAEQHAAEVIARGGGKAKLEVPLIKQSEYNYCGPASICMVLRYFGVYIDQDVIKRDLPLYSSGTDINTVAPYLNKNLKTILGSDPYQMVFVSNLGFSSGLISSIDKNRPVICNVETSCLPNYEGHHSQHYLVATGYYWAQGGSGSGGFQTVYYNDPNDQSDYFGIYECDISVMATALANNHGNYYIGT